MLWEAYHRALRGPAQPLQNGKQGSKKLGGVFFGELAKLKNR
jgi:hypothetical protein